MTRAIRSLFLAGIVFVSPVPFGCAKADKPATKTTSPPADKPAETLPVKTEPAPQGDGVFVLTEAETQVVKDFGARVADFMAVYKKLEATIPGLPEEATPEQIDKHQQALVALITTERKNAKRGDLFTPDTEALVRRSLATLVAGPDGAGVKSAIMDENPGTLDVGVNDRYPDVAPVSSMPVQFLETLPELPEELEYRFLGKHLVLVCTPARIVLDLTPNVLP